MSTDTQESPGTETDGNEQSESPTFLTRVMLTGTICNPRAGRPGA